MVPALNLSSTFDCPVWIRKWVALWFINPYLAVNGRAKPLASTAPYPLPPSHILDSFNIALTSPSPFEQRKPWKVLGVEAVTPVVGIKASQSSLTHQGKKKCNSAPWFSRYIITGSRRSLWAEIACCTLGYLNNDCTDLTHGDHLTHRVLTLYIETNWLFAHTQAASQADSRQKQQHQVAEVQALGSIQCHSTNIHCAKRTLSS